MPNHRLKAMQDDLEQSAVHLEALCRMLRGHSTFLRSSPVSSQSELECIERRLGGLEISVLDLRGAASNISRVA